VPDNACGETTTLVRHSPPYKNSGHDENGIGTDRGSITLSFQ
jgi:hypothetical protein